MLAIAFRFPAGRYHATPWGRHVNEADVEWPPSPWRILRSLIATWHRKADQEAFPEPLLESLIEKMAESLPVYSLPDGIQSHSRHYMPVREGKADRPVLIFDAFVRVDPADPLVAAWPDLTLVEDERVLLQALLRDLGFLGRAESWVEAEWLDEWHGEIHCRPSELAVNFDTGEALEPVRLISPISPDEYDPWRRQTIAAHGLDGAKLKQLQQRILATLPERFIDTLRLDTGDIQQAGWSSPPGARFVTYQRPYGCFTPKQRTRVRYRPSSKTITTVRFALAGKPLPAIEKAVKVAELVRWAAMGKAERLAGSGGIPAVLSGHGLPLDNRHGHAFYLPEDADGDGHIDHILVHADSGLSGTALRALDRITRLWEKDGAEWQVLMEQYGRLADIAGSPYSGCGRHWISALPYLHPWHCKKGFPVEAQLLRECRERNFPAPRLEQLPVIEINSRQRRPAHFYRFRSKRGLAQPDTQGSFWRLSFPEPVAGPLALGFGCHYGLGVFRQDGDGCSRA